jgi:hypothetical protein
MANSTNFLNTSHQTLAWFVEQNDAGSLDLRPGFQRRPVWTNEEKAFLIDSVLRGYPIPEVYVQSLDDGLKQLVAVVDGQQRLRACLEFMDNDFPVTFDINKLNPLHSLADTPWFGKKFDQLEGDERLQIRKYKLIVRDLEDANDSQVRHLFHRLNQSNVALNSQELRYSIYQGGLLSAVETLVSHRAWDHIRMFTKLQQRRMLDSEYVSELVIGHMHFPQNKKDDLDEYYRRYAADLPGSEAVLEAFDTTLNALVEAFPKPHMDGTRWYRKSDFYTLLLAITRGNIPLVDGSITHLKGRLVQFSDLVSAPPRDGEPVSVSTYREAVERAATDRGRRVRREEAMLAFLEDRDLAIGTGVPDPLDDTGETDTELEQEYEDVPLTKEAPDS